MTAADDLKEKVLRIARERNADRFNPLSLSDLIDDLGEDSKGPLNFALMSLMAEGKIGTRGSGSKICIIRVSR